MNRFDNHHHDIGLDDALKALSQPHAAPDFSRSIMGRLGYMRVGRAVARRRAVAMWANRASMVLIAGAALAFGWRVFQDSAEVRRPAETTIPQAISHDVQQQQQRLGNMFQTMREISAPRFTPRLGPEMAPIGSDASTPGSMDPPVSTDILGNPDDDRPEPPVPPPSDHSRLQSRRQEMRSDVNRVA